MPGALKVDIEAREVSEELELADTRGDAQKALAAARRYVAAGLAIRVCAPDFVERRPPIAHVFGRPFPAKYPGRCVVCDQAVPKGAEAVYRSEDRAIAHVACGGGR
jgi:hypothetical protein